MTVPIQKRKMKNIMISGIKSFEKLGLTLVIVYNTQRYHGAIGYVTPEQKHTSQAEDILMARAERKRLTRLHRLKVNRESVSQIEWKKAA
jgi:D-lyxose ketol-isomerase